MPRVLYGMAPMNPSSAVAMRTAIAIIIRTSLSEMNPGGDIAGAADAWAHKLAPPCRILKDGKRGANEPMNNATGTSRRKGSEPD